MDSRKIIVFDAQNSSTEEYQTSTVTFGEFKNEIGRTFEGKKVVVKETKVNLEDDTAILPKEETVLFLFQKESKFGSEGNELEIIRLLEKIENRLKPLKGLKKLLDEIEEIDKLTSEARRIKDRMV